MEGTKVQIIGLNLVYADKAQTLDFQSICITRIFRLEL